MALDRVRQSWAPEHLRNEQIPKTNPGTQSLQSLALAFQKESQSLPRPHSSPLYLYGCYPHSDPVPLCCLMENRTSPGLQTDDLLSQTQTATSKWFDCVFHCSALTQWESWVQRALPKSYTSLKVLIGPSVTDEIQRDPRKWEPLPEKEDCTVHLTRMHENVIIKLAILCSD